MLHNYSYTEIALIVALVLLIPLNLSASDRQQKILLICTAMFLAYFSWGFWGMGFRHFSITAAGLSFMSLMMTFLSSGPSLKRYLKAWLVFILVASIFLFDAMNVHFHENISVLSPLRFKVETLYFWSGFCVFSALIIALLFLKRFSYWRRGALSGLVMLLWIASFYMGSVSYWQFEKYKLYWGFGADAVNFMGETKLFHAAEDGNVAALEQLLDQGANPNFVRRPLFKIQFHEGSEMTPLEAAVNNNRYDALILLVNRGADINLVSQTGSRLIHHASNPLVSDLRILKFLLENGADINAETLKGKRPLNIALSELHPKDYIDNSEQIRFMIKNGASIDHITSEKSPIVEAITSANVEAVKILVEFGADPLSVVERGLTGKEWIIQAGFNKLAGPDYFSGHPRQDIAVKYHNQRALRYQQIVDFLSNYDGSKN